MPLLADDADRPAVGRGAYWLMCAPLFIRDVTRVGTCAPGSGRLGTAAGIGTLPGLLFVVARDGATTDAWARAAADYTEAIRLARDTGQTTELAVSLAGLSWLQARTGQEAECRCHAEEALALARSRDIHLAEVWALLSLGELELVRGDAAAALVLLRGLDELLSRLGAADADLSRFPSSWPRSCDWGRSTRPPCSPTASGLSPTRRDSPGPGRAPCGVAGW